MKEDTLMDMVTHMDDKTGLVHQMPFTCDRQGFPAILEKVNIRCFLLTLPLIERPCCTLQHGLGPKSIILSFMIVDSPVLNRITERN